MIQKIFILSIFSLVFLSCGDSVKKKEYLSPDVAYRQLFKDVQLQAIYPDSKTFCDAIPNLKAEEIVKIYETEKVKPGFDLKKFLNQYFKFSKASTEVYKTNPSHSVEQHINDLWPYLSQKPKDEGGTLIPLRKPYIVPGGRFREVYYWDSYFTMLGLQVSKRDTSIENLVVNFAQLIQDFGHIPNGNRSYYLSRSQPPFFGMMVELLSEIKNDPQVYTQYLPQMQKDYQYWMSAESKEDLENQNNAKKEGKKAFRKVVFINNEQAINRYYDELNTPRPEAYKEDVAISKKSKNKEIYRELRSAAESGWDFSSRWFENNKGLESIRTTHLAPIDLNCLLYKYELVLAKAYELKDQKEYAKSYRILAQKRKHALIKYFWNEEKGFYFDYDFENNKQSDVYSLAGMFPFYLGIATESQAIKAAKVLESQFLKSGGLQTTLSNTKQQWDAPNGWAPLQWVSYVGMKNYKQTALANEIKKRWLANNIKVYEATGKLVEKYDVVNTNNKGGGGEYPLQDGFGWTNGVLLKFLYEK